MAADMERSGVRAWIDKVLGEDSQIEQNIVREGMSTLRQGGESIVTGVLLGAIDAEVGLDTRGGIPIDLVAGVIGLGGSLAFADEDYADDLRNAGSSALAIFSYRKTEELLRVKKAASKKPETKAPASTVHGDGGTMDPGAEDPVVEAARGIT